MVVNLFIDQSRLSAEASFEQAATDRRDRSSGYAELAETLARIAPRLAIRQRVGRQQVVDTYHLTAGGVTI